MKFTIFVGRNFKEITRDPMSILMGIGFPCCIVTYETEYWGYGRYF